MNILRPFIFLLLLGWANAQTSTGVQANVNEDGTGEVTLTAKGILPKPPLFFSANNQSNISISPKQATQKSTLQLKIHQGKPELLTLGIQGEGEITSITGAGLKSWSVRTDTEKNRYLDLKPHLTKGKPAPKALALEITSQLKIKSIPSQLHILTLTPGNAVGFESKLNFQIKGIEARVAKIHGLIALKKEWSYTATGSNSITLDIHPSGVSFVDVTLQSARLTGAVNEASNSATFQYAATAKVTNPEGGVIEFLSGRAAVSSLQNNPAYALRLVKTPQGMGYQMVFDRAGNFDVNLQITAKIDNQQTSWQGWKALDFFTPKGAVLPITLTGMEKNSLFAEKQPVLLSGSDAAWKGFLPASGHCFIAWKKGRKAGEGKLAFTGKGLTDVSVSAGLIHQSDDIHLKILQGKLKEINLKMEGAGEILEVSGTYIAGWSVEKLAGNSRLLKIRLSLPLDNSGIIKIRSQQALEQFPVKARPLRLTPEGALRHSGYVRLRNSGAVRLGTTQAKGLMQLSPKQYPGKTTNSRQEFVYRYPSSNFQWQISADQILPEISVNQISIYQQTESDRLIISNMELDIREAPLREWEMQIPQGYAVSTLTGAEVADYVVGTKAEKGMVNVKVLFKKSIAGRQLIHMRLEKNSVPVAGVWKLEPILFSDVKSVRGYLGVAAAAGWNILPNQVEKLTETPLSYFPQKDKDLQQSYRFREAGWNASVKIEARAQSVQADVFHLYSLKEGMVYGSVLLNYFVVGAPVNQWEISVPESYGNVNIVGQNIRHWRREGDKITVNLEQPISGAATVLVSFENTMSSRGGNLSLGEVHPLNVQSESGFVEVVSPVLLKHKILKSSKGLLKIGAEELPAEFRMLTTAPAQAAWQYAARPFELDINIAWFDPGKTLDQVVDFAKLKSSVSQDGQVRTEAVFYVRTRARQALRMTLPAGSKFWEALANGHRISVRKDGEQYLLPLPVGQNPNDPVKVLVRYGKSNSDSSAQSNKVTLGVPALTAPVIIAGWKISGEKGKIIVPTENTGVRKPTLTETGFEIIQNHKTSFLLVIIFLAIGIKCLLRKDQNSWTLKTSFISLLAVSVMSFALAKSTWSERRINKSNLELTAQVVTPDTPVIVTVENIGLWEAVISTGGIILGALGGVLFIAGLITKNKFSFWLRCLGLTGIAGGILAQRGGAPVFFYLTALGASVLLLISFIQALKHGAKWNTERKKMKLAEQEETDEAVSLGAADPIVKTLLLGFFFFTTLSGNNLQAESYTSSVDSMTQVWKIEKNRLHAAVDITLNAKEGASYLLLTEPAVLVDFKGENLRVSKIKQGNKNVWMLVSETSGLHTAKMSYQMTLPPNNANFILPTGAAAIQKISAQIDESGLELYSPAAAQSIKTSAGIELILSPFKNPQIGIRPKGRDINSEETKFYAEVANLYLPSPGVVDGVHQVTIRPSSGKVDHLTLSVPKGFTVSEVSGSSLGNWRFDPATQALSVDIQPAESKPFNIKIETQRGLSALPASLNLSSITVADDSGETNMLGVAFGTEAQPGKIITKKLSVVNVDDFNQSLIPTIPNTKNRKRGVLHKVYRSTSGAGTLNLQVAPVMPEVRVISNQELTLGSERTRLYAILNTNITRAGIFKLSFKVPAGMEVESLTGSALSHWTESLDDKKQNTVIMHLNGKTIGQQKFALSLVAKPTGVQDEWSVPRLQLNEAVRQSGQLLIVPEKGIRVRSVIKRTNVSRLSTQTTQQMPARIKQSGGLAFKLLQSNWELSLGIEKLQAWMTANILHEVTLREGQTRTRLSAIYQIDHAAVKSIQVKLPNLSEDEALTVRASGKAIKSIQKVNGGDNSIWEVKFRRGVIGKVPFQIEYQRSADRGQGGKESITPASLLNTKRLTYFMAVRSTGRLDMKVANLAKGWRRSDWAAVAKNLRNPADTSMPDFCCRLSEPEGVLQVSLKRHQMANTLKLRVTGGNMMTIFSPAGDTLTSVNLSARVVEKTEIKVNLPKDAELYNVLVNGSSVAVVREGDTHLFHVSSQSSDTDTANVSLIYSTPSQGDEIYLEAPNFNVPIESLAWNVLVPEGYQLDNHEGDFKLIGSKGMVDYTLKDYLSLINQKRHSEAQQGVISLQKANAYMKKGQRKEAAKELQKVTKNRSVDAASNEDARVQLLQLQNQQAVWGLNSRRQRIYLDNKAAGNGIAANIALEDSAFNNPLFQGKQEFDVRQVDDFLRGNSQEEKTALKKIAKRLVDQQLATEPAPQTISTIVRGRGEIIKFSRGIQVEGREKKLGLKLDLEETHKTQYAWIFLMLATVGLLGAAVTYRKS